MTINLADNNPRVAYTVAEGATQTVFSVPFEFFEDADVDVYVDGTLKTEGTDYTLTGGEGSTGTLTFVTADPGETQQVTGATGGSSVVLVRRIAIERTTDFQQGVDISRSALNEQLDVLTALVADMNDRWDRAVHINEYDTESVNFVLPKTSVRAGNYFAFDANGDPVMTAGTTSDIIVSAFAETFLDDDTGNDVLNTLGVTATASELNALDGVTWTLTDYNALTSTAAELNILDGDTSATGTTLVDADRVVVNDAGTMVQVAMTDVRNYLLIDEDDMSSDTAAQAPTQQSVKAYSDAIAATVIGVNQTWQDVSGSRTSGTSYQNTTGRPIMVVVTGGGAIDSASLQVSEDDSVWVTIGGYDTDNDAQSISIIVPDNYYYRLSAGTASQWVELR